MKKTREFWLSVVIGIQFFIIVLFLVCLFDDDFHGDRMSQAVELKKIHDAALNARHDGKVFSKADVDKEIAGLKQDSYWFGNAEVIGADAHWTVILTVPSEYQTKFQMLLYRNHEWPACVLTSDDDGYFQISPHGKISHFDFDW